MAAYRDDETAARFDRALESEDIRWCWPVRHELTFAARGEAGIARLDRALGLLREIPIDRSIQRAVLSLMRELAAAGSHGAHRFPLTDLTVAVAAQAAAVPILHYDAHLDRLAEHLGVEAYWI